MACISDQISSGFVKASSALVAVIARTSDESFVWPVRYRESGAGNLESGGVNLLFGEYLRSTGTHGDPVTICIN